jgi:hypothetical protein
VIDDDRWLVAVATLPKWVRARCFASIGEVELEFDVEATHLIQNDPAEVRQTFFETLGGSWDVVDRRGRYKSVEMRYRLRRD